MEFKEECIACRFITTGKCPKCHRDVSANAGSIVTTRSRFQSGFFLSIPLAFMYFWAFGGSLSDADNNLWLGIMAVFFIATLPGSVILFIIGFAAAFGGKIGELIAFGCIFLSVANAHYMGMAYFGRFFKKDKSENNSVKLP